jgi:hypothetical protein
MPMNKRSQMSERTYNKYILYDYYAEIVIESETYGTFYAKIDLEDVDRCKPFVWGIRRCRNKEESQKEFYYAGNGKVGFLHGYLSGKKKGYLTDHKNLDTLDNRRDNLRVVSRSQNSMNRGMQSNNMSGHIGVAWNKKTEKWASFITKDKRRKHLGYYTDINDAIEARKEAEIKYFGEYRFKQA